MALSRYTRYRCRINYYISLNNKAVVLYLNSRFVIPVGVFIEIECMRLRKLIYLFLFVLCAWLAIATRTHSGWFPAPVVKYGGDTIWAGMFLFFLRMFFQRIVLWKLALICFALGVADETLQLYHAPWIEAIRHTRIGGLMLGFGFLWSDIICYAVGILMAYVVIVIIERSVRTNPAAETESR